MRVSWAPSATRAISSLILARVTTTAPPALAAAMGALCGAVMNFVLGRRWVFQARSSGILPQAARYAAVAAASAGWNALGEYLLHNAAHVEYVLARAVVSLMVGLAWNFPLQQRFVFRREKVPRR